MTVSEAQSRLTSAEFVSWVQYLRMEPTIEDRIDAGIGMICAAVTNPHRKKNAAPIKPKDCMPVWDRPRKTAKELEMQFRLFAEAHNSNLARKGA